MNGNLYCLDWSSVPPSSLEEAIAKYKKFKAPETKIYYEKLSAIPSSYDSVICCHWKDGEWKLWNCDNGYDIQGRSFLGRRKQHQDNHGKS